MTVERDKTAPQPWTVQQQTIYDRVSGLIFQFTVGTDGLARLRVFGNLKYGNREIGFDRTGKEAFSGTALGDANPFGNDQA